MTDDNEPGDVNNDIVGGGGDDGDVRKSVESMIVKPLGMYNNTCLLYTSPSPRDQRGSRMPSSA